MLLLTAGLALANGQTSHQWITLAALDHVPAGDLADLVTDEAVRDALLNGTMFPDGGYAVGDDYGEMAHWEPLQTAYLDWIVENYDPPYTGEAAQHVAFLLGMASHGMADQHYDSTYMERSKAWDPAESWACCSMDEATDVAMAAVTGPGVVPEAWWPDALLPLFSAQGHVVASGTVDQGQALLGLAIAYVGASAERAETVEDYAAEFPWACAHQIDPDVPGNPPREAEVVARYWEVVWDRLHGGDGWGEPVLGLVAGEPWEQPRDATSVEARVGVVFARGLDPATVTSETITVADSAGLDHPVTVNVFYGHASHVVNVTPLDDWAADTDYLLTVWPGVATFDGATVAAPITLTFSTKPAELVDETPEVRTEAPACGCGGGGAALLLVPGLLLRRRGRAPAARRT